MKRLPFVFVECESDWGGESCNQEREKEGNEKKEK